MARILLCLAASLCMTGLAAPALAENPTAEAAVTAYVTGIAAGDFGAVLGASAVDEMSAGYDFVASVEGLQALTPIAAAPTESPLFAEINRAAFTAEISRQVQVLAYALLSTSPVVLGKTVPMDGDAARALLAQLDTTRLAGLTVEKVGTPKAALTSSDRYLRNMAAAAKVYGADEMVERIALVAFEGRTFVVGFTVLRYGSDWGVMRQVSPIIGTSALGTPMSASPDDFDAALE